jgi:hypothetical protein
LFAVLVLLCQPVDHVKAFRAQGHFAEQSTSHFVGTAQQELVGHLFSTQYKFFGANYTMTDRCG